ncbi:hypothetical protein HHK36_022331 [Tetracentron sinense]|uniref:PGG domain-containing protein n=1 Tax=Tetracentron sinense TaxID=13715 RepID=A0A834YRQ9_TETSI|nr:hypothetical protein HHK36_022331 [Tetracentron sinense]
MAINLERESEEMDARLVEAATKGDVQVLRQPPFINSDLLQHSTTPLGNSALHLAVRSGQTEFCEELYRKCRPLLWKKNLKGETPLHIAARTGYFSVTGSLLSEICSVTPLRDVENGEVLQAHDILRTVTAENDTALHEAIRNRHPAVARLLTIADPKLWSFTNNAGESPLYLATQHGLEKMVLQALRIRPTSLAFSHQGPNGRTVLHAAIMGGHLGITRILVEERRELIKEKDSNGRTAFHYAASIPDITTVQLLLKFKPSVAYMVDIDGRSPLHEAAINGHIDIVKELLQHCPDIVDISDVRGQNVLHVAIKSRKSSVVKYLLSNYKLDGIFNQRDIDGNTALHLATIHCQPTVVEKLVAEHGVDVRAENKQSLTVLDILQLDSQPNNIFKQGGVMGSLIGATVVRFPSQPITARKYNRPATPEATSSTEYSKKSVDTILIVATLIATVAFTAALTMPGGYKSEAPNQGTAVLIRKAAFIAFVIFDASAINYAMCAVFLLLWASISGHEVFAKSVSTAIYYTLVSLGFITSAFAVAFYAVLSDLPWLAIIACLITCSVPITFTMISVFVEPHRLFRCEYFFSSPCLFLVRKMSPFLYSPNE